MSNPTKASGRPTRILVVSGASRPQSNVTAVVELAAEAAAKAGADTRRLDLATLQLPIMQHGDVTQGELDAVKHLRTQAWWADGFLIITPEYHGNMSGALKNWFDFLWHELAGKFAGVMSVTGGGSGDMSILAVKNCFAWCHGFTLPFHAAARATDFADDGALANPKVIERVTRIAFDVARYAPALRTAWRAAQAHGSAPESGVAGLHASPDED